MGTTQDGIMAALGPGQVNDLLLAYYKSNGAVSSSITDAEYEFLIVQGASPGNVQDMWSEYLQSLGWSGSVSDMKNSFWVKEGGGVVLGPNLWDDGSASGANWVLTDDLWVHTPGDTASLLVSGIVTIGKDYVVDYATSSITAGSVTAKAGSTGTGGTARSVDGTWLETLSCTGDTTFRFNPTNDFDGAVFVSSVREVL